MRAERALTPEQAALFWAIRVDGADCSQSTEIIYSEMDWEKLFALAGNHGILPLLYLRLKTVDKEKIPPAEIAKLKEQCLDITVRNLRMSNYLLQTLKLLAEEAIEAIPIKGPALAVQAYGDLALRSFTDLDILVRPQDFRKAYDVLTSAGYYPAYPLNNRAIKRLLTSGKDLPFQGPNGLLLEVHWAITEGYMAVPITIGQWWEKRESLQLNGKNICTLAPENAVLTCCIQGMAERYRELKKVADLTNLINSHKRLDWKYLFESAEVIGTGCILNTSLLLAEELTGVILPIEVRTVIHKNSRSRELVSELIATLSKPITAADSAGDFIFSIRSRERMRDRLSSLYSMAVKPKQGDWLAIDLPSCFNLLYYLIRPIRLAMKYGKGLFRSS